MTQDTLIDEKVIHKNIFTNDGDHDKFQHYFAKKDIDANLMYGKTNDCFVWKSNNSAD